jgi:hypothetical protein
MLLQFLCLVALSLAAAVKTGQTVEHHGDIIESPSLPGFNVRRVEAISPMPLARVVQNHMVIKRISNDRPLRRRPSASWITNRRRGAPTGVGNVTSVDRYDSQYATEVLLNGRLVQLVLDTGSADTWVRGPNFQCLNDPNGTQPTCNLGAAYAGDFPDGPIQNQHFAVNYGDGESIAGLLGVMNVSIGGIYISGQEIALASQGRWYGNNVSSGVLGMAYPSLTSAYWGTNLSDTAPYLETKYSPVVNSMIDSGIIQPYWCLAIDRNSSQGVFSLGGMPPVDLSSSYAVITPLLIVSSSL